MSSLSPFSSLRANCSLAARAAQQERSDAAHAATLTYGAREDSEEPGVLSAPLRGRHSRGISARACVCVCFLFTSVAVLCLPRHIRAAGGQLGSLSDGLSERPDSSNESERARPERNEPREAPLAYLDAAPSLTDEALAAVRTYLYSTLVATEVRNHSSASASLLSSPPPPRSHPPDSSRSRASTEPSFSFPATEPPLPGLSAAGRPPPTASARGDSASSSEPASPSAFRCLVASRLQSHVFLKRGPSLVACCGLASARTLARETARLHQPENAALLAPLVDLQEQFETLDYEEKIRAFSHKFGNLYDLARKTDVRMHALRRRHRESGRPLLPDDRGVKFLPAFTTSGGLCAGGIQTWTRQASPCLSLGFPRAHAAATARAAVEVAAAMGDGDERDRGEKEQNQGGDNADEEGGDVERGEERRQRSRDPEEATPYQDTAEAVYLTEAEERARLVERAHAARLRLHVVRVEDVCVRVALHFATEQRRQVIRNREVPQRSNRKAAFKGRTH
ncbi:hypothetical protein BESB_070780 [Besnoitia besnoiti]|uniref:Uncharacterized protein n=1 Tax=Besnoitia besnoiti TaxID=94643 RepID=A0A2A9MD96_BESBE|nr:uncharacterized protein BESB_070780 [Besnoitia besnoiti]PFH33926.1 hypothetical protein BESB_070780 [Besnoitia besnoiti]